MLPAQINWSQGLVACYVGAWAQDASAWAFILEPIGLSLFLVRYFFSLDSFVPAAAESFWFQTIS